MDPELHNENTNEDGNEILVSPSRPPLLGALIDLQMELADAYDEKYKGFLQMAWLSQRATNYSPISIEADTISKTIEQLQAQNDPKYRVRRSEGPINSSFMELFEFYAKFSSESSGGTFADINTANNTLGHDEYELFLRNFDVIPRLVSREEFTRVWKEMSQRRIDTKTGKAVVRMTLGDAQEFLVLLALYIFSALGMRKAVLAATGKVNTAQEMVCYLLEYMKFDDDAYIKEHIRNGRGRETQAEFQDHTHDAERHVRAAKKAAEDSKYKQYDANDNKKGNARRAKKLAEEKARAEHNLGVKKKPETAKRREAREARSPLKKFLKNDDGECHPVRKQMPQAIKDMLEDPSNTHVVAESKPGKNKGVKGVASADNKQSSNGSTSDLRPNPPVQEKQRLDYNNYQELFSQDLVAEIARFSTIKPMKTRVDGFNPSYGAFCDLGFVEPGSYNNVRFFLHNRSPNDLKIDVMATDFLDSHCKVTTKPTELVPGLRRTIEVAFHAPTEPRSVLGLVHLNLQCASMKYRDEIVVPVFFYTASEPILGRNRDLAPLRIDNLAQYIEKFVGKDFISTMADNHGQQQYISSLDSTMQKSLSMSTVDGTVSHAAHNGSPTGEAGKLGISFVKTRHAWYGHKPVGGGGQSISNMGSHLATPGSNPHLQKRAVTASGAFTRDMSRDGMDVDLLGRHVKITDDMTIGTDLTAATGW